MNLFDEYKILLEDYKSEQDLQKFLEINTQFIPREFVQNHGIDKKLVFRKLKLADNYITDFFYLSKSSDDWNCVFIELEKPNCRFFKGKSNDFHNDFLKGLNQIDKWRSWFSNLDNHSYFINQTLSFIRKPLSENPCYMKYILVTGRRSEYEGNITRRSLVQSKERSDFKILTYDSLLEAFEEHPPLYLCVKKNEYIELHSDSILSTNVLDWMDASQIKVKRSFKDKLTKLEDDLLNDEVSTYKEIGNINSKILKQKLEKYKEINTFD